MFPIFLIVGVVLVVVVGISGLLLYLAPSPDDRLD